MRRKSKGLNHSGGDLKIIYSNKHKLHVPTHQLFSDGLHTAVEVPDRAECILHALQERKVGEIVAPDVFGMDALKTVHDEGLLDFLSGVYDEWEASGRATDVGLIPHTFAMRSLESKPEELIRQAGYYCFETQTPILRGTWEAAQQAACCALTGADLLLAGESSAYALCRPPGHHAGRDLYGGYCYLNNAALAAQRLSEHGRVAILDVDYHHGNGTQAIFYDSADVLFVSIHADPNLEYPYYSGYASERGRGNGVGYTLNLPLSFGCTDDLYLATLNQALERLVDFNADFWVVSLGVDLCKDDPLCRFDVSRNVFAQVGRMVGAQKKVTLFVQEGGYNLNVVGNCVADVLEGFIGMCD
jgi:acetoin utilization deacetylase AcuC-like enzyme